MEERPDSTGNLQYTRSQSAENVKKVTLKPTVSAPAGQNQWHSMLWAHGYVDLPEYAVAPIRLMTSSSSFDPSRLLFISRSSAVTDGAAMPCFYDDYCERHKLCRIRGSVTIFSLTRSKGRSSISVVKTRHSSAFRWKPAPGTNDGR